MEIKINGEPRDFPSPISVQELVYILTLAPQRIAVEVNKTIVPRASWESAKLKEGDQVEIVHFVGGGNQTTVSGKQSNTVSQLRDSAEPGVDLSKHFLRK